MAQKAPAKKQSPAKRRSRWWRWPLAVILSGMALAAGVFVVAYLTIEVPDPDDFAQAQSTEVYFSDGTTSMGTFSEYARVIVDGASLPEHVGLAVVASEDRTFFTNDGVDLKGILRAFINNVQGNPTQGGSTITQQYVERYYLGTTTDLVGKLKEALLAVKISSEREKDEILSGYLNTIYFGRGAYGIEMAAQRYFDKPASELTLSESAMLAGIIPSPSNWDPAKSPERAEQRWNRVLDLMVEDEHITQQERDAQEFPEVIDYVPSDAYAGTNGYLLRMVRDELTEVAGLSEAEIDTGGLAIITTIDAEKQAAAVAAVDALPEDRPDNNYVGLVSMDPSNGELLAVYGGADYLERQQNTATQDIAEGGSTFKPFALISALEQGASLKDQYASYSPMEIDDNGKVWKLNNFDSVNRGKIDLIAATQNSVNTVYGQLNVEYGPANTIEVATRLGLPEDTVGLEDVPSNVLGNASPHVIDMARAYGTLATGGVRHDPHIVREVRDSKDNLRFQGSTSGERVVDANVIANATYAMQAVVNGGTGKTAMELGRPAAGKTGSSNSYRSAWFVGFVPQIVTAVAMYQVSDDGTKAEALTPFGGQNPIAGGTFPTRIWTDYMKVAVAGLDVEEFPDPVISEPTKTPPPAPSPTPTEEPTDDETEEPTDEPTEEATPSPSPSPSPTPVPEPTPDLEPTPDPEPTDEPTDDAGG